MNRAGPLRVTPVDDWGLPVPNVLHSDAVALLILQAHPTPPWRVRFSTSITLTLPPGAFACAFENALNSLEDRIAGGPFWHD